MRVVSCLFVNEKSVIILIQIFIIDTINRYTRKNYRINSFIFATNLFRLNAKAVYVLLELFEEIPDTIINISIVFKF